MSVHPGPARPRIGAVRPAWAEVDLGAIRANAALLAALVAPAELCAVVKAWGYGHGAVEVAQAAIEGGATWLAVALVEEGRQLRAAGVTAPILLLSQPPVEAMGEVVRSRLTATVYTLDAVIALASAAEAAEAERGGPSRDRVPVHIKVDTGMHRVGSSPGDAVDLALQVAAHPSLELEGLWTHFAVADEPANPATGAQLAALRATADRLAGPGPRHLNCHRAPGWHRRSPWPPRSRW